MGRVPVLERWENTRGSGWLFYKLQQMRYMHCNKHTRLKFREKKKLKAAPVYTVRGANLKHSPPHFKLTG